MTINDNSTKSINAAIIDLQNQIKQLQHKIDILSKNQLKEDDIELLVVKKFTFGVDGNITTPLGTVALKSELENTFQDHLIGYIRNKPIYRKVILDSTAYNVPKADIELINLGGSNRKFIRSGGYVKYSINDINYRIYPINSKTCAVEIFDQDGIVFLESTNVIVGTNIDIYAWIDYMQS